MFPTVDARDGTIKVERLNARDIAPDIPHT